MHGRNPHNYWKHFLHGEWAPRLCSLTYAHDKKHYRELPQKPP